MEVPLLGVVYPQYSVMYHETSVEFLYEMVVWKSLSLKFIWVLTLDISNSRTTDLKEAIMEQNNGKKSVENYKN